MESTTKYTPSAVESKWYNYWMEHHFFESKPDDREPFTILIPPPNVTGVLHMGHMLNNTIQDVLIRRARMQGKNACWVPGTDHASIATEAKVVALLREQNMSKYDIGREQFLQHAWDWKEKYGGIILDQLKRLGASCDWSRTRFTLEPSLSRAVVKVFVDLHNKGKIYRGLRMTNWDPEAKTVLSSEEVIYKEEQSQFFYIRYRLESDPSKHIIIATQRPETIMADTAIAVHPEDPRFADWIGRKVLIPLINRAIPIIADTYVDREFGTGALKITPAHDINDYEVGQRHGLEVIDILNEDATLNEQAQILVGEDRFIARKKIRKMLEAGDFIEKIEDYKTNMGRSERSNAVVEPRLTLQWFLDMKDFAATALAAVKEDDVRFFPEHMINMYQNWLNEDNVRDWCISRQLWWGQRIPAWFYMDEKGKEHIFVAEHESAALDQARMQFPEISLDQLRQDEDVVDTWFSSWLWPMSVFDAFDNPEEFRYYYPTNVLVTGWDIMFFWVARMIMAGYEWSEVLGADMSKGRQPFRDVYFTGMVRDNKRRKMSKSLGNSPDALELIEKYGADGVRFGMLSCASAGNDIIFDAPIDKESNRILNESKLCEQGRNFCNKMWNVYRGIQSWEIDDAKVQDDSASLAVAWFDARLNHTLSQLDGLYDQYRLSEVLMNLYKLVWDDFCSWYFELLKPPYGQAIDRASYDAIRNHLETVLRLLHPYMPFITEELWQDLTRSSDGKSVCIANYPEFQNAVDLDLLSNMDKAREFVTEVRNIRNHHQLPPKERLTVYINSASDVFYQRFNDLLCKMGNIEELIFTDTKPENAVSFMSGSDECSIPLTVTVDHDAEKQKLEAELEYYQGFLSSIMKKLGNERFVASAPEQVIALERKKQADAEAKIETISKALGK